MTPTGTKAKIPRWRVRRNLSARDEHLSASQAGQEMLRSSSWRITEPVRWIVTILRRVKDGLGVYLRYHKHRIDLEPIQQVERIGDAWQSTGNDPQFRLLSSRRWLPRGWALFRCEITALECGHVRQPLSLKLYYDDGAGFSEGKTVVFASTWCGTSQFVFRLPNDVKDLRLDPAEGLGRFRVDEITVHEFGKVPLLAFVIAPHLRHALRNPWDFMINTVFQRRGLRGLKSALLQRHNVASSYALWIEHFDTLTDEDRDAIRRRITSLSIQPQISVVMPVYNAPEQYLCAAIESLRGQLYANWELCIADDASTEEHGRKVLDKYRALDSRIKVVYRTENGHISAASNTALGLVEGEFVALMDQDDALPAHALYMVAEEINRQLEVDLIYSDEDKIDAEGRRFDPYFKPDWNPDLLLSQNFISHLGVYRTAILKRIGGFRIGYEGCQDYDLALRVIEQIDPTRIRHIPHVLYHWRAIEGSTALNTDAKQYAHEAARNAIRSHLQRQSIKAEVTEAGVGEGHRVIYPVPEPAPLVSLIVPTKDNAHLLRSCVEGILTRTDYDKFEILVVNNRSEEPQTLDYFEELKKHPRVRVLNHDAPFNFSAINNRAVIEAKGSVLGLLNNDIEVIDGGWLTEMVSHAVRPGVGAVGAKLLYPDNTTQHVGVVLGIGGIAAHVFIRQHRDAEGYFGRAKLLQNWSCVTAACMLIPRKVFEEVGGLDETNLPVAFNDVDLCIRICQHGYRIVWTPYAELYHHEFASRGRDDAPEQINRYMREVRFMRNRWERVLRADPAYNPNLSLGSVNCELSYPPRVVKPWIAQLEHPKVAASH